MVQHILGQSGVNNYKPTQTVWFSSQFSFSYKLPWFGTWSDHKFPSFYFMCIISRVNFFPCFVPKSSGPTLNLFFILLWTKNKHLFFIKLNLLFCVWQTERKKEIEKGEEREEGKWWEWKSVRGDSGRYIIIGMLQNNELAKTR